MVRAKIRLDTNKSVMAFVQAINSDGSIDKYVIGKGEVGPITEKLHHEYLNIVRGKVDEFKDWLTAIY